MNDSFEDSLRRRFAAAEPVQADEAFVQLVSAGVGRRRRRLQLLAWAGGAVSLVVVALLAPQVLALGDWIAGTAGTLARFAPSPGWPEASLGTIVVIAALGFAVAAVAWVLRRN
jgi:hypothetical protein